MKLKTILAVCAFIFSSTALADQKTKEQCDRNVDAFISGIELAAQQKGTEPRLKDLSVKDIRAIQKDQGSCVAEQEVRKRTFN